MSPGHANGGHFWWNWQAIFQAIKMWHLMENMCRMGRYHGIPWPILAIQELHTSLLLGNAFYPLTIFVSNLIILQHKVMCTYFTARKSKDTNHVTCLEQNMLFTLYISCKLTSMSTLNKRRSFNLQYKDKKENPKPWKIRKAVFLCWSTESFDVFSDGNELIIKAQTLSKISFLSCHLHWVTLYTFHLKSYYQQRSREMICLVATVCLGLWNLRCAPLQWYGAMLCTINLHCAPPTCDVHHGAQGDLLFWEVGVTPNIFHFLVVHMEHFLSIFGG